MCPCPAEQTSGLWVPSATARAPSPIEVPHDIPLKISVSGAAVTGVIEF